MKKQLLWIFTIVGLCAINFDVQCQGKEEQRAEMKAAMVRINEIQNQVNNDLKAVMSLPPQEQEARRAQINSLLQTLEQLQAEANKLRERAERL